PKVETSIVVPVDFTRNIKDLALRDAKTNSWTMQIEEVGLQELAEVNIINQITPTLMINQLIGLMSKPSFIIQVSAKEGTFNANKKIDHGMHAHTNMCKAGMNMLIRTLCDRNMPDTHFYAVDPGFVSGIKDIEYPLSIADGANRVLHPIISHFN